VHILVIVQKKNKYLLK